eukprot:gnl/TRDRNA2_/TRDRNA2_38579_c1_seq1.p1 gnl/TRDRNA2_/TRDRNA2_38579_c1~~gnl/TRDRNA2_/TRDRNA2_38579_c1_seq1.p1  ORF type:complete len:230 (-),score=55.01 gnl/TRDRNA2_/TRDRNA2_38579_c1_seq1:43-636(-)
MVTDMVGDKEGMNAAALDLTIVGSDDGTSFWTVKGKFNKVTGGLTVDFSPIGGKKDQQGYVDSEKILWTGGGGQWPRLTKPDFESAATSSSSKTPQGFFTDPNHYVASTFIGTRMISEDMTIIGTDDGKKYWSLKGTKVDGGIMVDFSPKGGPSNLKGTFKNGKIEWADGNYWDLQGFPELTVDPKYTAMHAKVAQH